MMRGRWLPAGLLLAGLLLAPGFAHADLGEQVTAALERGSLLAYALVFLGGVLTSLTPCVYPMIPITLGIFGARGENVSRRRALALAATYVAGIGVMYASLGVGFSLAGKAFGTHMASPWVMVPIAVLFLAMAASMFGAFELALPVAWQTRLSQVGGAGWGGAFAMGLVGGIIAAPCTGPVLASVLAFVATKRSVMFGGSLLFVYAMGIGVLFFVLAATAASLPRSGRWMEAVKSLFGVVMILAALYFLRSSLPLLERYASWKPAFALVQVGLLLAGGLAGAIHLGFGDGKLAAARKAVGILLMVVGGFGLIGWMQTARPFTWVEGEAAALAAARQEGRPLLLDFGASWCVPCKEMETRTFADPSVRRELGARWVAAHIDCSEDDDAVAAVKARYGATTLPSVVLLDATGKVVKRWNRQVEAPELLEGLRTVR